MEYGVALAVYARRTLAVNAARSHLHADSLSLSFNQRRAAGSQDNCQH
jgi:hypothetical protein